MMRSAYIFEQYLLCENHDLIYISISFPVTLLSASGDDGVAGYKARGNTKMCGYWPQFPATSPYVTAVGGTQVSWLCYISV